MDTNIRSRHAYVLMLMSRPSSLTHKLLMLVFMLMLASQVGTGLYCIRTFMSRKLISDLYRLVRVMFVTCVIFAISTRNVEETFASFFSMRNAEETFACIILCFLKLTFIVFTLFGQKIPVFSSKCFLFNISFCILKVFVFPAVAHFLGKELVEEMPSEVRTVYILGKAQSTTHCQT